MGSLVRNASDANLDDSERSQVRAALDESIHYMEQQSQQPRTKEQLLVALDARLAFICARPGALDFTIDCAHVYDHDTVQALRKHLGSGGLGVVIIKNAVSEPEISDARRWLAQCMVEMFGYDWPADVCERVKGGDFAAANEYRNPRSGYGNSSFGFQYLQYRGEADQFEAEMEVRDALTENSLAAREQVKFAYHPIQHRVLMRLMCEGAPRRTRWLLTLSSTPGRTRISDDSVKVVEGRTIRGQTKTVRTIEHVDEYGARHGSRTGRLQALINDDQGKQKLFFVLGTTDAEVRALICAYLEKPNLFRSHGFKRLGTDENAMRLFETVLDKYAFAPPPRAMVLWSSGVVHFEAQSDPIDGPALSDVLANIDSSLFTVASRKNDPSAMRLRFVIGTHTPTYDERTARRLAVIAMRGAIPGYNFAPNKRSAPRVHENTVCLKTTQYRRPRVPAERERQAMRNALLEQGVDEEFESLSPLYKHMYGVAQPHDTLGF